jgi:hypothetical protein
MAAYSTSVRDYLTSITRHNRPGDHAFFEALNRLPVAKLEQPEFLAQIGNLYQVTLHVLQLAAVKVPHLTTRDRHARHTGVMAAHAAIFADSGKLFHALSQGAVWRPEHFGSLAAMKKGLPAPVFNALTALDDLYAMAGGLGAWVLCERLLADWLAAMQAVFNRSVPGERLEPAGFSLLNDTGEAVLALARDVVNASPQIVDGQTLRGMQAAMEHFKALWAVQHAMIVAEDRK